VIEEIFIAFEDRWLDADSIRSFLLAFTACVLATHRKHAAAPAKLFGRGGVDDDDEQV
jgi:hypothetical protein